MVILRVRFTVQNLSIESGSYPTGGSPFYEYSFSNRLEFALKVDALNVSSVQAVFA